MTKNGTVWKYWFTSIVILSLTAIMFTSIIIKIHLKLLKWHHFTYCWERIICIFLNLKNKPPLERNPSLLLQYVTQWFLISSTHESLCVCIRLIFTDRPWPRLTRGSLYPKPSVWWRAHRRSAACTPSSGQNAHSDTHFTSTSCWQRITCCLTLKNKVGFWLLFPGVCQAPTVFLPEP